MTFNELCSKAYYKNKHGIILNMDCVEAMKLMPDECVDLTVTSPPYDNLRKYNGFSWDFESTAKELYRITKQGGVVVWVVGDATIKGSETGTSFKQALYFKEIGFNLYDTMIWEKSSPASPTEGRYNDVFEYMFILSKGKPKTLNLIKDRENKSYGMKFKKETRSCRENRTMLSTFRTINKTSRRFNVWQISRGVNKTQHPAIFPEALANDHIISWSNENDIIFDPFMGSGTTAKMAMLNNRKFIGCELSENYCEIIKERLDNVERN